MTKKARPPKRSASRKVRTNGRSFGIFRPAERLIYHYHDGERDRRGDPLALLRGLTAVDGLCIHVDVELAVGQTPDALNALGRVVNGVRSVFGVKALDDGGLADAECLALLVHYLTYVQEVQRDLAPLPMSPPSTACRPPGSTTDPSSASGSTASGP